MTSTTAAPEHEPARKVRVGAANDPAEREADHISAWLSAREATGPLQCAACAGSDTPCPACAAGSRALRRSTAKSAPQPALGSALLGRALTGPGAPVPDGLRKRFEHRLGVDLSAVRLHSDARSAEATRSVNARAFTFGQDVVFGHNELQPDSADGQRLLAHELAHTLQQRDDTSGVLRRAPEDDYAGMTSSSGATVAVPTGGVCEMPRTSRMPDATAGPYDPCAVSSRALTNAELLAHWQTVTSFLGTRRPSNDTEYNYANLRRRLAAERHRRIGLGHAWLGVKSLQGVPETLYLLHAIGPNHVAVTPADSATEGGMPRSQDGQVLTPGQFADYLAQNQIQTTDVESFYRAHDPLREALAIHIPPRVPAGGGCRFDPRAARPDPIGLSGGISDSAAGIVCPPGPSSFNAPDTVIPDLSAGTFGTGPGVVSALAPTDLYGSPFDLYSRRNFLSSVLTPGTDLTNPDSVRGAGVRWRGMMFEDARLGTSLQTITDPNVVDLNRVRPNFPTYDVLDLNTGMLESITHSTSGTGTSGGTVDPAHYLDKYMRMMSTSTPDSTLASAATALSGPYPDFGTPAAAAASARLLVPDEHVVAVRQAIVDRLGRAGLSRSDFAAYVERRATELPRGGTERTAGANQTFAALVDATMAANPITHDGVTYSQWSDLASLKSQSRTYRTVRQQVLARLRTLAQSGDLRAPAPGSTESTLAGLWRERATSAQLQPVFDALMRNQPVSGGSGSVTNWSQIEAMMLSPDPAVQARVPAIIQELTTRAGARVGPARATLASILAMETLNRQAVYGLQRNMLFPPEVVEYHRLVANGTSEAEALNSVSGGSAARAARISGLLSAGMEGARLLSHAYSGDIDRRMVATSAFSVGMSVPVGYASAWTETQAAVRLSTWATSGLAEGETAGLLATSSVMGGRLFVSTGVGAVAAPVMTLGTMGFQDALLGVDYTRIDYAAAGTRSAAAGAGGALAAGVTGAVLGSEVPVLGTAIGFVVGFGGYMLIDSLCGDNIEAGVRDAMGENGCVNGAED